MKISEGFNLVSFHHKWNEARLLSPEASVANALQDAERLKTNNLEVEVWPVPSIFSKIKHFGKGSGTLVLENSTK